VADLQRQRLVVGMSGSSAPQLGHTFLQATRQLGTVETHFVLSQGARRSIELELGVDPAELEKLADVVYDARDLGASISSGSFLTIGMVIIPCSMRTLPPSQPATRTTSWPGRPTSRSRSGGRWSW
jgi:polyprenyl P-hydroxybenzoate/phenylacrylic acid decarboxylase-like protein